MIPVINIKQPVKNKVDRQWNIDIMQCAGVIAQRVDDGHEQVDNVQHTDDPRQLLHFAECSVELVQTNYVHCQIKHISETLLNASSSSATVKVMDKLTWA